MAEKFGLENLSEDLLLRILILTDIYTVLTISQVNTFFHAIASTKQLWLLLTKDLFLRGLVDIHSDEVNSSLSSDELIAQVKRAVYGPRTWSPDSPTAPTLIQQFTVEVANNRIHFASLLPGYIIFRKQEIGALECYNLSTGHLVWNWARSGFVALETDFSVCRGHKVTVFLTMLEQASTDAWLEILDVDLESGHSHELLQFHFTSIDGIPWRFRDPQCAEDYLGCIMGTCGNNPSDSIWMPFLINLRTEQYIFFDCGFSLKDKFYVIPGYILLVSPRSEPFSVRTPSISSFEGLWKPLSDFTLEHATSESTIAPSIIPITGAVGPRDKDTYGWFQVEVFLTESLLRRNTYLLRIFDTVAYSGVLETVTTASIHRLDLSEQTPKCTLLSAFAQSTAGGMVGVRAVTRAGYNVFSWSKEGVHLVRQDDGEATFINFDGTRRVRQATLPHNGGLVVLRKTHAEILYYD
ncbi:hypothetical protein MSAN_02387400 [Mycena sanguinolenta]|uniref:F-box domain-containing protein n=1 Tax=Mycena sanguinolenta TaxID=230812 RepID=A0A8H6X4D1_9AGAR|nr:hypothetical protein MSAN_02387400 [Mycena sanguinolenta]